LIKLLESKFMRMWACHRDPWSLFPRVDASKPCRLGVSTLLSLKPEFFEEAGSTEPCEGFVPSLSAVYT